MMKFVAITCIIVLNLLVTTVFADCDPTVSGANCCPPGTTGAVTIAAGAAAIPDGAFYNCPDIGHHS